MSQYDDFRAPRYVDFANLHRHHASAEGSSFFDHSLESDTTASPDDSEMDDTCLSMPSEETLVADCDDTLLDNALDSPCYSPPSPNDLSQEGAILSYCSSESVEHSAAKGGVRKNIALSSPFQLLGHGGTSTPLPSNIGSNRDFTTINAANSSVKSKLLNLNPVSPKNLKSCIKVNITSPSSNCNSVSFVGDSSSSIDKPASKSSKDYENFEPSSCASRGIRSSTAHSSGKKRRSRSTGSVSRSGECCGDNELVLQDAIQSLNRMSIHTQNVGEGGNASDFASPQLLADCVPSAAHHLEKQTVKKANGRVKRKLSPVPRDYSRQPEKFISLAEHIARNEKQVPDRFRTIPKAGALKTAIQSKAAKTMASSSTEKSSSLPMGRQYLKRTRMRPQGEKVAANSDADKGVKVACWPKPKVRPFPLIEYKKKEPSFLLPKTMFAFDKQGEIELKDRRTPIKAVRPTTKTVPFSFDERDQEILKRKQDRIRGLIKDSEAHCCYQGRRRSKSQGDKLCQETGEKVQHAHIPSVLYKPPFVPIKLPHKPTKPVDFHLRTEKRAKERDVYEDFLREKERVRQVAVQKYHDEKLKKEKEQTKKLRKELVHKAQAMPSFSNFIVKPSTAPLTNPRTPIVLNRSKKQSQQDIPCDEPMA